MYTLSKSTTELFQHECNIIEMLSVGIGIIDSKGNLYRMNSYFENLFQKTKAELECFNFFDLIADQLDQKNHFNDILLSSNIQKTEKDFMFNLPDNKHFWGQLILQKLSNLEEEENFYVLQITDITNLKEREISKFDSYQAFNFKQNAEEKEKLKNLIKVANAGTWEWNVQTGEVIFNERWAEILGYTLEELQPISFQTWVNLVHPEDNERITRKIQDCFDRKTEYFEDEARMRHKNGNWFWVLDRGKVIEWTSDQKPIRMIGAHLDIHTQKSQSEIYNLQKAKLENIINGANYGTWEWNVQTGETIFNERWAEIIGYTLEELQPISIETWLHYAHPDDLIESGNRLQACFDKKTEYYSFESRMKHKNGDWVWVLDRGKVMEWTEDGNPLTMYGTHLDITELKKNEFEFAKSAQQFKNSFQYAVIGKAIVGLDGRWIEVNNQIANFLGYHADELKNLTFQEITYPDDLESDLSKLQDLLAGKITHYIIDKRYIHKTGKIIWGKLAVSLIRDENNEPVHFVTQISDIDELKRTEQELNSTLNQLKGVLESSTHVSLISTTTEGIITSFNKGAENLLGYSSEELIGIHSPALIHNLDEVVQRGKELSEIYQQKIEGFDVFIHVPKLKEYETREWSYVRKDGSKFPVQLTVTAIKNKYHEIIGYLGIATDISELKKAENELKFILNVTNEQNERLLNFAHIVSHNLRSHASNFSMILNALEIEEDENVIEEMTNMLRKASNNLNETVQNLNDVVLINTQIGVAMEPIHVKNCIEKAIENLNSQIKQEAALIINDIDPNLKVYGVKAYLDSVFLNLISNSIKYRSKERQPVLKISSKTQDNKVYLYFQDNGLGIDTERYKDKLFGMYKTFHGNEDARGIGLFITKNQILAMKGQIDVESKIDVGTKFIITLEYAN